jgi:hypothetical protein
MPRGCTGAGWVSDCHLCDGVGFFYLELRMMRFEDREVLIAMWAPCPCLTFEW